MHSYLPAIGFGHIQKKSEFQKLLKLVQDSPTQVSKTWLDEESTLVLYTKEVAPGIGLAICGEESTNGSFQMEHHFPYLLSDVCSTEEECTIEKASSREAYNGVCDDYRLGLNLIFAMNNFMEYCKYKALHGRFPEISGVCLSGLAVEGKILLPSAKKTMAEKKATRQRANNRRKLLEAAKGGNPEAIDSLTLEEINLSNKINKLVSTCDIYTMIESFVMPCGMECDQYSVMGQIQAVRKSENAISGERLYIMDLLCNDMPIRVCVSRENLMGEPAVGRRFKGDIWLQGKVVLTNGF